MTTPATDESLKETFESIVIAFILAFIFRAYVVEAFIIPTGSMAPTLLGQHFEVRCEQCGYDFTIDHGSYGARSDRPLEVECPMCRYPQNLPIQTASRSGDRLLVQKYLYDLFEPHRWDVVVFRNPQELNADQSPGPKTNYIKRLVGLPNEQLQIIDGNVFVRPLDQPDAGWRIARKVDPAANPHWERVQRSVWQPIYHSQYVPRDQGRVTLATRAAGDPARGRQQPWRVPWVATPQPGVQWDLGDSQGGWRRNYLMVTVPGSSSQDLIPTGELVFDWEDYYRYGTPYAYNLLTQRSRGGEVRGQPIEDIRLAATIVPQRDDTHVEFEVTTRLDSGPTTVVVSYDADGGVSLRREDGTNQNQVRPIASASTPYRLGPGQARRLELWVVDQALLVFIDGREVLRKEYDLPMSLLRTRPPPHDRPSIAIRVRCDSAKLQGIELDRDLAYTPRLADGTPAVRGAPYRTANGTLTDPPPLIIRAQRYFVLGDNSPISSDGRFWDRLEPWVEQRMYEEASTQPADARGYLADHAQVVPRGLMVGRAFFIYFPAPHAVNRSGRHILPNFGEMRFVH